MTASGHRCDAEGSRSYFRGESSRRLRLTQSDCHSESLVKFVRRRSLARGLRHDSEPSPARRRGLSLSRLRVAACCHGPGQWHSSGHPHVTGASSES